MHNKTTPTPAPATTQLHDFIFLSYLLVAKKRLRSPIALHTKDITPSRLAPEDALFQEESQADSSEKAGRLSGQGLGRKAG
jgi:hypothetical protein